MRIGGHRPLLQSISEALQQLLLRAHSGSPLSIGWISGYGYGRDPLAPVDELPLF